MSDTPVWTPGMDEHLRENWSRVSMHTLAERFQCKPGQVRWRAAFLRLPSRHEADVEDEGGVYLVEGDGPSCRAQDERFIEAMTAAIRAGREHAPIGIVKTPPGLKTPLRVPQGQDDPHMTSPAASCAEA